MTTATQDLTDLQVAAVAYRAGFRGTALTEAVARAKVESTDDPTVRNSIGASGLWQILQSAHPEFAADWSSGDWTNPLRNAQMAFTVWKDAGSSFGPWDSEGTAYIPNLPAAQKAVGQLAATGYDTTSIIATIPGTAGASSGSFSDASATATGAADVESASVLSSWVQPVLDFAVSAGLVVGGVALILFGMHLLLGVL